MAAYATYASMYVKYKAEPVSIRHKRLAAKFIERATRGSETVRDLVEHYKGAPGNFEGVWAKHEKKRVTILGKIFADAKP